MVGGPASQAGTLLKIAVSNTASDKGGGPIKNGDVLTVTNEKPTMVKAEKGWIFEE